MLSKAHFSKLPRLFILALYLLLPLGLLAEEKSDQDLQALHDEALSYFRGDGVTQDFNEAARLFKIAAREGHAPSQNMFGYMHSIGRGARKSWGRAAYWWKLAAEQEYVPALYNLSTLYMNGWGVEEDPQQAIFYLEKVVQPSNPVADTLDDFEQYNRYVGDSCFRLGSIYQEGLGVSKDPAIAAKWMHQAAIEGHVLGIIQSGLNFALGEGVEADSIQANLFFNMALAELSNYQGSSIRSFYLDGIQNEDRFEQEMDDFQEEQRKMVASMQAHVGTVLYNRAEGDDREAAMHWLKLAAEGGSAVAKAYLGTEQYLKAQSDEDRSAARQLLQEAADESIPLGQYNLAVVMNMNPDPEDTPALAEQQLKRAARLFIYPAIRSIEQAQQSGLEHALPEKKLLTLDEIVEVTRDAAHQGNMSAAACYGYMLYMGIAVEVDEAGHGPALWLGRGFPTQRSPQVF